MHRTPALFSCSTLAPVPLWRSVRRSTSPSSEPLDVHIQVSLYTRTRLDSLRARSEFCEDRRTPERNRGTSVSERPHTSKRRLPDPQMAPGGELQANCSAPAMQRHPLDADPACTSRRNDELVVSRTVSFEIRQRSRLQREQQSAGRLPDAELEPAGQGQYFLQSGTRRRVQQITEPTETALAPSTPCSSPRPTDHVRTRIPRAQADDDTTFDEYRPQRPQRDPRTRQRLLRHSLRRHTAGFDVEATAGCCNRAIALIPPPAGKRAIELAT